MSGVEGVLGVIGVMDELDEGVNDRELDAEEHEESGVEGMNDLIENERS